MPIDFGQGRIYIIRNTVNTRCYCGSTVRTLAERMYEHRKRAKGEAHDGEMEIIKAMREHGVDAFHIELVKDFPCERREQLNAEEGKVIREMKTLVPDGYNAYVAGRKPKEYREDNSEALKQKNREWQAANKDKSKEYRKAYYNVHKVERAAKQKAYYEANVDKKNEKYEYIQKWRAANPDKVKVAQKKALRKYAAANREKINQNAREYKAAHKEAFTQKRREFEAANREKINQYAREYRAKRKAAAAAAAAAVAVAPVAAPEPDAAAEPTPAAPVAAE